MPRAPGCRAVARPPAGEPTRRVPDGGADAAAGTAAWLPRGNKFKHLFHFKRVCTRKRCGHLRLERPETNSSQRALSNARPAGDEAHFLTLGTFSNSLSLSLSSLELSLSLSRVCFSFFLLFARSQESLSLSLPVRALSLAWCPLVRFPHGGWFVSTRASARASACAL